MYLCAREAEAFEIVKRLLLYVDTCYPACTLKWGSWWEKESCEDCAVCTVSSRQTSSISTLLALSRVTVALTRCPFEHKAVFLFQLRPTPHNIHSLCVPYYAPSDRLFLCTRWHKSVDQHRRATSTLLSTNTVIDRTIRPFRQLGNSAVCQTVTHSLHVPNDNK